MSKLPHYELRLTDHALERYVERIGPITRPELLQWCKEKFATRFWYQRHTGLMEFSGVWWGCKVSPKKRIILLTTCYGKGNNVDLAAAISWERKNKDIVRLN
ncbi:MAG: hypothetical protein JWM44_1342 [Bacilli bacterium]|nr:hypothetical protein [Bacilli bacterium]